VVYIYWCNVLLILKIQDQGITILFRRAWDLRVQVLHCLRRPMGGG